MPLFTFLAVVTPCLMVPLFLAPFALDSNPHRKDVVTAARRSAIRVESDALRQGRILRDAPPRSSLAFAAFADQPMVQQDELVKRSAGEGRSREKHNSKRLARRGPPIHVARFGVIHFQ
jgi:hypothetical protein